MAHINSIKERDVIHNGIREATDEVFGLQTKIETRSGVGNDLGLYIDKKGEFEQTIRNYVNVTSSHLAKLKTRLNAFVTINRLPAELLTHIVFFADISGDQMRHPYMSYTWVCRHWRSTLIQDANLWRLIRFESDGDDTNSIVREIVQRSKSATLDVEIANRFDEFMSLPEAFFALTSRIRRLWLPDCDVEITSLFLGHNFSSLRGVLYDGGPDGFLALLPVLVGSELLDTFQYKITEAPPPNAMDQLASIFARLRNLHITIDDPESDVIQSIFALLDNNTKLQNLGLFFEEFSAIECNNQMVLPELQFLTTSDLRITKYLRTPKLSSLNAHCWPAARAVIKEFVWSPIIYLYITEYFMAGLNEDICSQSFFSTKHANVMEHFNSFQYCFSVEDFMSDTFPRDGFRLEFSSQKTLVQLLSSFLPGMTSLTDLQLLFRSKDDKTLFTKIITLVPSVERIVVGYDCRPKDYISPLRNPSLCPRLTHLSLVARKPYKPDKNTGNSIGKLLTQCLQARQGICDNTLEYITLEISCPLPDKWMKELKELGTTVVTE